MPADRPDLAIIIVTYESATRLARASTRWSGSGAVRAEVVVVDNRSADGTAGFVREGWPSVRVIDAGSNVGFSRANNLGAAASESEFLLLLNPDTVVPPGAVAALVRGLASHPDAATAGPRLLAAPRYPALPLGPALTPWGRPGRRRSARSIAAGGDPSSATSSAGPASPARGRGSAAPAC